MLNKITLLWYFLWQVSVVALNKDMTISKKL
ncbi:hypothetical protein SAMN05880573_1088 [Chryseobacterium sp. RU33C]|nr:hypothetical protein SAMN05880573_1088 [Chryseobacterium sp. RU33C]